MHTKQMDINSHWYFYRNSQKKRQLGDRLSWHFLSHRTTRWHATSQLSARRERCPANRILLSCPGWYPSQLTPDEEFVNMVKETPSILHSTTLSVTANIFPSNLRRWPRLTSVCHPFQYEDTEETERVSWAWSFEDKDDAIEFMLSDSPSMHNLGLMIVECIHFLAQVNVTVHFFQAVPSTCKLTLDVLEFCITFVLPMRWALASFTSQAR